MAQGFGTTQVTGKTSKSGNATLFEKVTSAAGGEKKSLSWYRTTVKTIATNYNKNFNKYIRDEKKDRADPSEDQDQNELRRNVVQGHMVYVRVQSKNAIPSVL